MRPFSERYGLATKRSIVQLDSVDDALRIGLWNVLGTVYFNQTFDEGYGVSPSQELNGACRAMWRHFLKRPLDQMPSRWENVYGAFRQVFFEAAWNEVYDFVQVFPLAFQDDEVGARFRTSCNHVLEQEMSGYRFVGAEIARVTDPVEVAAIEEALALPGSYSLASQHLQTALAHLSDREAPDYRNSIEESISAVESVAALVTGQKKSDLGAALAKLQATAGLHPALKSAFLSLYGYTNGDNGIRHALLEEAGLTHDDAKLMLVLCSAFVNYVKALTAANK